jgi:hypothetical protein
MSSEHLSKTVSKKDEAIAKRNILPCHQTTFPADNCFKRIKEGSACGKEGSDERSTLIVINLNKTSYLDHYGE